MKSLGNFPDIFMAEICGQPDALRRAADGLAEQESELMRLRDAAANATSMLFTGMGSSYDACYPAVTALAARGVAATMLDTAELAHFRMPTLRPETLLVCVSQSGESAELIRLMDSLPTGARGPTVAAVTNGSDNTLARAADIAIDTRAGEEHGPSTMTFATALGVLDAAFGEEAPFERAALEFERVLYDPQKQANELAEWIEGRPNLALLGRGSARAAAEMGALTLKEAARFPAESLQTAQFRHGPLELAGPRLAAILIATEETTRGLDMGLAEELAVAGAAVLVVSQDGSGPGDAHSITVGPLNGGLAAAVATVPAQLLAWRLAKSRGLSPGEFAVAAKVTTRE
jgi:glucosamine--fructose-6-phosphate aminotransferase (isomerizing)